MRQRFGVVMVEDWRHGPTPFSDAPPRNAVGEAVRQGVAQFEGVCDAPRVAEVIGVRRPRRSKRLRRPGVQRPRVGGRGEWFPRSASDRPSRVSHAAARLPWR